MNEQIEIDRWTDRQVDRERGINTHIHINSKKLFSFMSAYLKNNEKHEHIHIYVYIYTHTNS